MARSQGKGDLQNFKRCSAVYRYLSGESCAQIAASCCCSEESVRQWVHKFIATGIGAFVPTVRRGRKSKLSKNQKSQLFSMIEQGPLSQGYMGKLRAYSPDLNPIEGLWKKIKAKGTHLVYFKSFNKLMDTVTATANWFAKRPDEVLPLFGSYA